MTCKCGFENKEDAKFCGSCGRPLQKKKGSKAVWIILGVSALVVAVLCFVLFSGPSVKEVTEAIDSIGSISMASIEKLTTAAEMYDDLSPSKQEQVTNANVLFEAIDEYNHQYDLIQDAKTAIDELGTISLDSEDAISAARAKYNQAVVYDSYQEMADHKTVLEDAEDELKHLQNEQEQAIDAAFETVDGIVANIAGGQYNSAKNTYTGKSLKIHEKSDKKDYANRIAEAILAEAQKRYDEKAYLIACRLLEHCELFDDYCDSKYLEDALALKGTIEEYLAGNTPKNGAIIDRTQTSGRNTFNVTAGPADTCVKVELIENPEKYIVYYVRAGENFKINIPNGEYHIKYTTGPVWYGEEDMFGPDATYILLPDVMDPRGYTSGDYVYWHDFTLTLDYGYGNDTGAQNITPEEF